MLLLVEDVGHSAAEGQTAGEGFVEKDSDAVPVARWPGRLAGRLLWRHVSGGAKQRPVDGVLPIRAELSDEPEVEQDHSPGGRDEHVRGLDVAMDLACLVKSVDSRCQLPKRRPQPLDVARRG